MSETGVVKFRCDVVPVALEPFPGFEELNAVRRQLLQLRLLGVDGNGIAFGNLSVRLGLTNHFYITGTGTSGRPRLELNDMARVTAYSFERNWLRCEGATMASSESLTHAAIYEADAQVGAIAHGHSAALWRRLLATGQSTAAEVEYGTPAMAQEVRRLFGETELAARGLFAMGGHENGVIAFGPTLQAVCERLVRLPPSGGR